ncbi:YCF48-related protein [uncultured Mucilaginibacter sp.]|uniref:WD40/YVTN/BNR-like repeat-containing protein n=1 Tax=uncultured Mucilaginibacter sp. TaxID=797541 RepID=UPI0025CBAFA6|nr:YCF48-related protein [uncultured Mucilaginibacter sp.]
MRIIVAALCVLLTTLSCAQTVMPIIATKNCSIRGLCAVNNNVAWLSASNGNVAISTNGGKSWSWQQLNGYETYDFRDIEAFSSKEAIIMSSGTPAVILKTTDGGVNWRQVFFQSNTSYFLDGMAFINRKHGFCMGDPINGRFLLLETMDGGNTWFENKTKLPALPGEAAFAASGTSISYSKSTKILVVVTGGSNARKFSISKERVQVKDVPLAHGQTTQGAFSYATGNGIEVIVGGNYERFKIADSTVCFNTSTKSEAAFMLPKTLPVGYQSCVTFIKNQTFISTGVAGSHISIDGGANWKQFDAASYNVCQNSGRGNLIILAGDKGCIGIVKF